MAIDLKQNLNLKLSQQLVITPQLQQAIKLLQLSRTELSELVQEELLENPTLEESGPVEDDDVPADLSRDIEVAPGDEKRLETVAEEVGSKDGDLKEPREFDWENYVDSYNDPGYEAKSFSADEMPTFENMTASPTSLQDHLEWQLRMTSLSAHDMEMTLQLIGVLDDNGYLTSTLEQLSEKFSYSVEELQKGLEVIQAFDPLGVGSRDLRECLLIQARQFGKERPLLERLIENHLSLLEKRDFGTISKKMKIPVAKVSQLAQIISEMEPKPGRSFGGGDTQYITPDVHVYKVGDEYAVVLNEEGLPRLRVSNFYRKMLMKQGDNSKMAKDYVQDKLKSAMWLIKSIHQRQRTLYRVSKCIVKFQRDFFDRGIGYLRPMILRDVAEEIGMHESTVSRATSNKYIHTPQGIYELKFFFNSGVSAASGQDVAAETVKEKIRSIIASENARSPFSDKDIVDLLHKNNIAIARRTVAKYREMLGILPSSKRKQLY